jgi:hypothetical protein
MSVQKYTFFDSTQERKKIFFLPPRYRKKVYFCRRIDDKE